MGESSARTVSVQSRAEIVRRFFDGLAAGWDERCRCDPEKVAAIVTLAGIAPGSRVADIACGTGVLFPALLSRSPAEILGIDLSERMIARAREKCRDPRVKLLASDLFDVRESGLDTAILFSAYPHFPDKRRLAARTAALLRTGGRVMVAHSESRAAINGCHRGTAASRISVPLRPVGEEAAVFAEFFEMDMQADTPDLYFFSGVKK